METLMQVISNEADKYQGNLEYYFKVIWNSANADMPYHNIRHMFHVMWASYQGAEYYQGKIERRDIRNMLISALFHDYDHTGKTSDDELNINRAIEGFKKHCMKNDLPYMEQICDGIRATQFPHKELELPLHIQILRDADIAFTLSDVWIQTVNFGLNKEMEVSTEKMLKSQEYFLKNIMKLSTEWANKEYASKIDGRITETKQMIKILYE